MPCADFDKPFGDAAFNQPFEASFEGGTFDSSNIVINSKNPFADAFEEQQTFQAGYDQPGSFEGVFDHQPFGGKFSGTPFGDEKETEPAAGDTENPFGDDKPFEPDLESVKEPEPPKEKPAAPVLSPSPTPVAQPPSPTPGQTDAAAPQPQGGSAMKQTSIVDLALSLVSLIAFASFKYIVIVLRRCS